MDEKTTGIVSYLTWVGLLIAYIVRKEKTEYTNFHIRQSLGIMLTSFAVGLIVYLMAAVIGDIGGLIGWALYVLVIIMWIIGFIGAVQGEKKLVPFLGDKFQEWFKSI
ncbi:MAG TPA: DUF4870 domain-containing protein [Moheibacter sp.]|nr:DUF4870 domain-containing protein [Moheibacter sp.]